MTDSAIGLGVLGIDHGHIFGMLGRMKEQGCTCRQWWSNGPAVTEEKFRRVFPELERVDDRRRILDDPDVGMVLISAVPSERAALAIEAMEAGKDVMVDKPGCTTKAQLAAIRDCVARTGRIWTVNFSERFEVPAVTKAQELVEAGAIGRVVQTVGLGPHKKNLHTRPDWYFERERYGGILCDIGSHQIDQFMTFTGSTQARIAHALVENITLGQHPGYQEFGEIVLVGDQGHGYARIDWFTPDGMPTWGDGRLFIVGTEGQIELRKYTEIGREHVTDTLYLVNGESNERIDCRDAGLPYFRRLIEDVLNRTETAVSQEHTFRVVELALTAQEMAEAR